MLSNKKAEFIQMSQKFSSETDHQTNTLNKNVTIDNCRVYFIITVISKQWKQ